MNAIAVIPARGGSKGIPRKNLLRLGGKPLIVRTVEEARKSRHLTDVVVSTDDASIAEAAKMAGATVIWRPAELSTDEAGSESVLLHALDEIRSAEGNDPDVLVFLQCTSPFLLAEDIDGVLVSLTAQNADCAFTVCRFHGFLWQQDGDGHARAVNHDSSIRLRRQDKKPEYLETGAVYAFKSAGFRKAKHRFFGNIVPYEVPANRAIELDEPEDVIVARALLEARSLADMVDSLPRIIDAVVFDFDGVFTDNKVIVHQDGTESVVCDRSDGWGIGQLKQLGLPILVLSTEKNPVVQARCRKLEVECLNGIQNKLPVLDQWCQTNGVALESLIYVGNDVNDSECLLAAGCGIVVADAHPEVKVIAKLVLSSSGGLGAVREVTDLVLAHATKDN